MYKTELISAKPKGLFLFKKTTKFLNLALKTEKIKQNIKIQCCVNPKS
jgi:hypothetical protein